MKHFFALLLVLLILGTSRAQNKKEGLIRFTLVDPLAVLTYYETNKLDSCKLYIFKTDRLVKTINISNLLHNHNDFDKMLHHEISVTEGSYNVVIENLNSSLILVTNVKVERKKISFLPINFNDLNKIKKQANSFMILDMQKLFDKYINHKEYY